MHRQFLALLALILATLKDTLLELLGSKKFLVLVSGIVTAALAHFHYDVAPDKVAVFLATVSTYLIGQGIADHGKGAAEVTAAADKARPIAREIFGQLLDTTTPPLPNPADVIVDTLRKADADSAIVPIAPKAAEPK